MYAFLSLIALAVAGVALVPAAADAKKAPTRDVLVVSNNWEGTAASSIRTTSRSARRSTSSPTRPSGSPRSRRTPTATFYFDIVRNLVGEGHNQYVDDGFTSPDGKVRLLLAAELRRRRRDQPKTERIVWRTKIDGYRADHMAISKNGKRLLVSASTANVVDVIDTATGRSSAVPVRGFAAREQLLQATAS